MSKFQWKSTTNIVGNHESTEFSVKRYTFLYYAHLSPGRLHTFLHYTHPGCMRRWPVGVMRKCIYAHADGSGGLGGVYKCIYVPRMLGAGNVQMYKGMPAMGGWNVEMYLRPCIMGARAPYYIIIMFLLWT